MHTLPHENPENGYSLRVGKNLPPNAANLAYVHTDTPAPTKNLLVQNTAHEIPENRPRPAEKIEGLYTQNKIDVLVGDTVQNITLKNLMNNGDFQNGFTNFTFKSGVTKEVVGGTLYLTTAGTGNQFYQNLADSNKGSVMYYATLQKASQVGVVALYNNQTYSTKNKTTDVELLSSRIAPQTSNISVSLSRSEAVTGTFTVEVYWMVAVNLTQAFGAGKEPSKEFMDKLVMNQGYFDETIILTSKSNDWQEPVYYSNLIYKDGQPFVSSTENILLTSQYDMSADSEPLHYISSLDFEVDISKQMVRPYINGRRAGDPIAAHRLAEGQLFIYENTQLSITKTNQGRLTDKEVYKIIGVPNQTGTRARLYVLTNFAQEDFVGYQINYPAYMNNKSTQRHEILNARPLFTRDSGNNVQHTLQGITGHYLTIPVPQVGGQVGGYYVALTQGSEASNVSEINFENREPHTFSYQITADVQTRFSEKNPYTIRIGLAYINDNVANVLPLTGALRALTQTKGLFPEYVSFENPHSPAGYHLKESADYWNINLHMPREHYLDYDVIIISGYGRRDMTPHTENLKSFLSTGGLLLVDNNGTGNNVLSFLNATGQQSFISDVRFSTSANQNNRLSLGQESDFYSRYYPNLSLIGLGNVYPTLQFSGGENASDWKHLIIHETNSPALTLKNIDSGRLLVSNMGLMTDILLGNQASLRLMVNLLMYYNENRSFKTPVFYNQVLHKDDLYPEEYQNEFGEIYYVNDQSDDDQTQLVAKKQLAPTVYSAIAPYLPYAYQRPISAKYYSELKDSRRLELTNADFESSNTVKSWTDSNANALPGFRYVVTSKGTSSKGEVVTNTYQSGRQAIHLNLTNSKAFFEQELLSLAAGQYLVEAYVKSESATGGGLSVYNASAQLIDSNESVSGTQGWYLIQLYFELTETQTVYIRLGASTQAISGKLWFDNLTLNSSGSVYMKPESSGQDPLYAYALQAKGQNYLLGDQFSQDLTVIPSDHLLSITISIRAFVYKWHAEYQLYHKEYGKERYLKVDVQSSEGQKVLGNLLTFIPGNEAGYEWRENDNIFYEVTLADEGPVKNYVNISLYDPSTQTYFYSPDGQWVINREDLWWNGFDSTVQLRVQSTATALQLTGVKYHGIQPNNQQIGLLPPATIDERDRWYPRIQNGSFIRRNLSNKDLSVLNEAGRGNYLDEYMTSELVYNLPEYYQQSFYPRLGDRYIEGETAEYLNPNLVRVQRRPLIVAERQVTLPLYNFSGDRKVFQGLDTFWDATAPVRIFQDEQLILSGYDVDFENGRVIFTNAVSVNAKVWIECTQNNVRLFKRRLANQRIQREQLTRVDDNTLKFKKEHLAYSPHPDLYRNGSLIHPKEYWIDHRQGLLHFYQTNRQNIFADYSYYIKEKIDHLDINRFSGEIYLKQPIHFRDEVIVDYLYEENTLEYKGFYDEDSNIFQHLDLNPTAGHTYTAKRYNEQGEFLYFYEESSEKLLNKEIFFYLMPNQTHNIKAGQLVENYPMRHCFNETEWLSVKASYPNALLIGRIFVRENTNLENIVLMDARQLGGGLKETISQETIEQKVGYTSAFWDIGGFDGLSYYRNGVSIIRLPSNILRENGGQFSERDVEDILNKYLSFGILPIIEYVELENFDAPVPDSQRML